MFMYTSFEATTQPRQTFTNFAGETKYSGDAKIGVVKGQTNTIPAVVVETATAQDRWLLLADNNQNYKVAVLGAVSENEALMYASLLYGNFTLTDKAYSTEGGLKRYLDAIEHEKLLSWKLEELQDMPASELPIWDGFQFAQASPHQSSAKLLYSMIQTDDLSELLTPVPNLVEHLARFEVEQAGYDSLYGAYEHLNAFTEFLAQALDHAKGDLEIVKYELSKPFKKNKVTQVAMMFTLSDDQTITIFFHNPEVSPSKLKGTDIVISWKYLLNRRDITGVIQPNQGEGIAMNIVAGRLMKLANQNSARFARTQARKKENEQKVTEAEERITEKERLLEEKRVEAENLEAQLNLLVHAPNGEKPDNLADNDPNKPENIANQADFIINQYFNERLNNSDGRLENINTKLVNNGMVKTPEGLIFNGLKLTKAVDAIILTDDQGRTLETVALPNTFEGFKEQVKSYFWEESKKLNTLVENYIETVATYLVEHKLAEEANKALEETYQAHKNKAKPFYSEIEFIEDAKFFKKLKSALERANVPPSTADQQKNLDTLLKAYCDERLEPLKNLDSAQDKFLIDPMLNAFVVLPYIFEISRENRPNGNVFLNLRKLTTPPENLKGLIDTSKLSTTNKEGVGRISGETRPSLDDLKSAFDPFIQPIITALEHDDKAQKSAIENLTQYFYDLEARLPTEKEKKQLKVNATWKLSQVESIYKKENLIKVNGNTLEVAISYGQENQKIHTLNMPASFDEVKAFAKEYFEMDLNLEDPKSVFSEEDEQYLKDIISKKVNPIDADMDKILYLAEKDEENPLLVEAMNLISNAIDTASA